MFPCPFCNIELTDERLSSGRCPHCGGVVKWDEPADMTTPASEAVVNAAQPSLPRVEEPAGRAPAAGEPETYLSQTALAEGPQAPAAVGHDTARDYERGAPPGGADAEPSERAPDGGFGTPTLIRPADTRRSRRTVPADINRVNDLWRGTYTVGSSPQQTLKGAGIAADGMRPVVIKPRVVQGDWNEHLSGRSGEAPDYELLEVIGEGGVGVVYSARQTSINRTVAVKMLRSFAARDPDSRDKFLVEAAVTGELDHPNIVPIYDLGTDESGAMFYSMKRVEGTPWSAVIREKPQAENLEILLKAADAIAFAHARGVVHRDLKPENVMLGNFGEVLVMDWGIALSTSTYLRQGSLTQSNSMGGTPAYMAPEMATGPLSSIGPHSDVYLLGALLFEIVTGLTPHTGADVLECLHAAARNEIQPTEKEGELLDIAYRAMSSDVHSRYGSVHDFQQAIRTYQSHSESIVLVARAEEELENARQTQDYKQFARALFAYQEALTLWPENSRAASGLLDAQLAYASMAYEKGDYDLGLSVLEESERAHRNLRRKLLAAQQERQIRQQRMRNIRRTSVSLAAAIIIVLTIGVILIQNQKKELDLANNRLQNQQTQLVNQQTQLIAQRRNLELSNAKLDEEQGRLKISNEQLEKQKTALSNTNQQLAVEKQRADDEARVARDQEQRAEQATYVAQIGLAAAQIDENAFLDALRTIATFQQPPRSQWRHWEWGRLNYLCERSLATIPVEARVECAAMTSDERWLVAGLANGQLGFWKDSQPQPAALWPRPGAALAVALAPGAPQLAVSYEAGGGSIELLSFDPAQPQLEPQSLRSFDAHSDDVVSLVFSRDGRYLLSSSLDETAILWDVATARPLQVFRGHFGPVWDAALSSDNREVYTAGDDHTVGIWNAATGERTKRFRGHQGPVYALDVTRDSDPRQRWIVSAGEDRILLAWQPESVTQFDYERLQRRLSQSGALMQRSENEAQPIRVLLGHTAEVRTLTISADKRYVASGAHDNTVRVWKLDDPSGAVQPYRTLRGHGGWVRFAAFAADGAQIVSAGYDQQIKRWDVARYAESIALEGHEDSVLDAQYSLDGKRIITVGRDQKAIVWDVARGEPLHVLREGHEFLTSSVALFPDGSDRIVTSAGDGTTILWELKTAAELQKLTGTGQNSVLDVSPAGDWLFTGSEQNEVLAWPMSETGAAGEPQRLAGHAAPVSAITFSPDRGGDQLVAFSGDTLGAGILWQRSTVDAPWSAALRINSTSGRAIAAARFLPNQPRLLTVAADQTLRCWDTTTGRELVDMRQQFDGPVKLLELLPGGEQCVLMFTDRENRSILECWDLRDFTLRQHTQVDDQVFSLAPARSGDAVLLAVGNPDNALWRWDLASNRVTPFWSSHAFPATVWSARFLPDDARVVTVGGNVARVWDVATGRRQQSLGPHGPVLACAFAPNGQRAATAGQEGSIKIWNLDEGRVLVKLPPRHLADGRTQPIHAVVYSPRPAAARRANGDADPLPEDADLLLSAGGEGTARMWWISGEQFREGAVLKADGSPMLGAAFSPDGRWIATASADGIARLWDAATGTLERELSGPDGHRLAINHVAFSRDGRWLATASDDNTAIVWEVASGTVMRRFTGHTASVTSAGFSPDARRLITASKDGSAKLWDARTGNEILTLKGHSAELTSASFAPDGRTVLTTGLDAVARVWPATDVPPALIIRRDPMVYGEPGATQLIDEEAEFTDPDDVGFGGAELIVTLRGSETPGLAEHLRVRTDANRADGLVVSDMQHEIVSANEAASVLAHWDEPSAGELRIRFTGAATHGHITAVLRRLEYSAEWQALPTEERSVELVFREADMTESASTQRVIRFQPANIMLAEEASVRAANRAPRSRAR